MKKFSARVVLENFQFFMEKKTLISWFNVEHSFHSSSFSGLDHDYCVPSFRQDYLGHDFT